MHTFNVWTIIIQNLNIKECKLWSYRLHKLGTQKVLRTDRVDLLLYLRFTKAMQVKSSRNIIIVSKSFELDQARHFVGPDLDPNCLKRLSGDNKGTNRQRVTEFISLPISGVCRYPMQTVWTQFRPDLCQAWYGSKLLDTGITKRIFRKSWLQNKACKIP